MTGPLLAAWVAGVVTYFTGAAARCEANCGWEAGMYAFGAASPAEVEPATVRADEYPPTVREEE